MKKAINQIFLKLMLIILKNDMTFISVYYFLSAKMKLEKVENLVANLHDKTEYATHIRNLKQALNHEFVLKKVHKIIKFKQKTWLKSYVT